MVKGTMLMDMHDMLMEQMTRLADAESDEELKREQERGKAMANIARTVIDNAKLLLEAQKVAEENCIENKGTIYQLEG